MPLSRLAPKPCALGSNQKPTELYALHASCGVRVFNSTYAHKTAATADILYLYRGDAKAAVTFCWVRRWFWTQLQTQQRRGKRSQC
jgi:hypothetical protein